MKTIIAILFLTFSLIPVLASASEAAQVLGYTFGASTHAEVESSLRERGGQPLDRGISAHANGPMLRAGTPRNLGIEGLQDALMIFNERRILTAAQLKLPKHRYDAIVAALKAKYPLLREQRPHVGNRAAEFRSGDVLITVDAPHMSFDMTVSYRTFEFQRAMDEAARSEAEQKRQNDLNQL